MVAAALLGMPSYHCSHDTRTVFIFAVISFVKEKHRLNPPEALPAAIVVDEDENEDEPMMEQQQTTRPELNDEDFFDPRDADGYDSNEEDETLA